MRSDEVTKLLFNVALVPSHCVAFTKTIRAAFIEVFKASILS